MIDIQHLDRTGDDRRPAPERAPAADGAVDSPRGGTDVSGFTAVDTAADPRALLDWMDTTRTLPGLRIANSLAVQALALRSGHIVADIGCGPGEDAVEMARRVAPDGQVIGVDASEVMLREARRRAGASGLPVTVRAGDAYHLPLPDDAVDRCRADTLLQHVSDPARAVAEMVRVTRPGGRIALLEFDQATLVIDHPDRAITHRVVDELAATVANGWAGRGLHRLLTAAGARGVTVDARFVESDHPFLCRLLAPVLDRLTAAGAVSEVVAERWWRTLADAWQSGSPTAGAVVFVAAGELP
jgi:ubiquinone/menaquinone biosynthesis C-methylase UbiE